MFPDLTLFPYISLSSTILYISFFSFVNANFTLPSPIIIGSYAYNLNHFIFASASYNGHNIESLAISNDL